MDHATAAAWIYNEIERAEAGWSAGKLGTSEFNALVWYLHHRPQMEYPFQVKRDMFVNAGLWVPPNSTHEEVLDEWAQSTISAISEVDGMAVWNPIYKEQEAALIKHLNPNATTFPLRTLEPFYAPEQQYITKMVKGSIAVVSPFAKSITEQIPRLQEVFPKGGPAGQMWVKDQVIEPVKAYYSPNITKGETWPNNIMVAGPKAAITYLADQVTAKPETRYALVGIGALGLPLVAELKRRGIIAVHTGGGTQIMLGIKGRRWDNHSTISKFYNMAWIRPSSEEIPTDAVKIERGCYW